MKNMQFEFITHCNWRSTCIIKIKTISLVRELRRMTYIKHNYDTITTLQKKIVPWWLNTKVILNNI